MTLDKNCRNRQATKDKQGRKTGSVMTPEASAKSDMEPKKKNLAQNPAIFKPFPEEK